MALAKKEAAQLLIDAMTSQKKLKVKVIAVIFPNKVIPAGIVVTSADSPIA